MGLRDGDMLGFRWSLFRGGSALRRLLLLSVAACVVQVLVVVLILAADLAQHTGEHRVELDVVLPMALLGLGLVSWLSHRLHSAIAHPIARLQQAVETLDPDSLERVNLPRTPELASLASSFNAMADRLAASTRLIAAKEARLSALFTHSSDMVVVVRPDTTIVSATPSAGRFLGVPADHLTQHRFFDLVAPEDRPVMLAALSGTSGLEAVEFRMIHVDGRLITTETHIVDLTSEPAVQGLVLTMRDVSERKQFEGMLSHQAFHDALTGLPNRALLRDRLAHALLRREPHEPLALLFIDLNDFKTVNDSLGHSAGDELLQTVAARLELHLRAGDTAARLGGDEFVILLEHADEQEALAAAARIREALNQPANMSGIDVYPGGSIGVAVSNPSITSADELLAHADAAMYLAKAQESGHICLYDQDLSQSVLRRLELKGDLQRAVSRGEIEVFYQPIINLATGRLAGVEALARWLHPTIGQMLPTDFISLAEQTGLIVEVGRDVLDQACRQFAHWQQRYGNTAPGFVSVNISGRQLREPSLASHVTNALHTHGLRPDQLVLEITESILFSNHDPAVDRLVELKKLGVLLAIDDFGTGYSSLAHLQHLPVDILKLDKHFIDELEADQATATAVARAIIDLGHHLGLRIVAEGIEQGPQAVRLRAESCDYGQGYLFGRPGSAQQISAMLADSARREMAGTEL
jgi:diguanylate cyclase (GGDEF)-like protein/PAS domain S-box-containing protein